jgi:ribosomal protein S18 acetylase RimI-like enzyme
MPDITLNEATTQDIAVIRQLAETTWNQHYPTIISQEQINYMLDRMYSAESLMEQLVVKKHRFFLIVSGNHPIGFISVNQETPDDWFLNKFYIDQTKAGKGIGEAAFKELCGILKPDKLTLTVNRQNFKSVNFYFKIGFRIERVADFDIGNGYQMNDFVMVWKKPL